MQPILDGQEKMDLCVHRGTPKEVFIGCPCNKQKKTVYECTLRKIPEINSAFCAVCPVFEKKA